MKTCILLTALFAAGACAQPTQDPWLPPAARAAATPEPETRGAALQAQVLAKLQAQFQRADSTGRGALTIEEARRAGWAFAVQNFAEIDTAGRGEIRLADLGGFVTRRAAMVASGAAR
ncbi:hypothetical protein [Pelomonas sp. KK5]|uniref:hypothetical protein n=1 Tax=Pelomonas sp. KK5 TaxID=1855730 RepID=UPI00097C5356|nr:hypothetical protein [Pelomonas sp. KK5]